MKTEVYGQILNNDEGNRGKEDKAMRGWGDREKKISAVLSCK